MKVFEEDMGVCECYPEHCVISEYGGCWCGPRVDGVNEDGGLLIIHQDAN
jgi:ferredoxin-thioredoxin reductase catalytic subunit